MAKIEQNREDCIGCGACAAIAPDHWEMHDDNKAIIRKGKYTNKGKSIVKSELEISDKDFNVNKDAAEACPVNAIGVYDKSGKKVV